MNSERSIKIFREVVIALLICGLAGLPGGTMLGIFEEYILLVPGLLLIIPPTLGLRGNVYGALASRFSTSLHLGIKKYSIKDEFYSTFGEVLLVSYFIPIFALLLSKIFYIGIDLSLLLIVMVSSAFISGIILTLSTIYIATLSFKRGWNPDNVTSPLITTIGDIITIPTIFLGLIFSFLIPIPIKILILVLSVIFIIKWLKYARMSRIIVMLICSFIGGVGGVFLEFYVASIINTGIIVLIPVFMDGAGNISSIFSSRLGTEYHLGTLSREKTISTSIIMFLSATSIFFLISLITLPLSCILSLSYNLSDLFYANIIGMLVSGVGIALGPVITLLCAKTHIDPDDVSIPVVTTICDLLSILIITLTYPMFTRKFIFY